LGKGSGSVSAGWSCRVTPAGRESHASILLIVVLLIWVVNELIMPPPPTSAPSMIRWAKRNERRHGDHAVVGRMRHSSIAELPSRRQADFCSARLSSFRIFRAPTDRRSVTAWIDA
jgi:hypothetical protein